MAEVALHPPESLQELKDVYKRQVVTRDIPDNTFAAGVPCKGIRPSTQADSMLHHPELFAGWDLS